MVLFEFQYEAGEEQHGESETISHCLWSARAIPNQAALGTIHFILHWTNVRGSASDSEVEILLLFSDTDLLNAMLMH